METKKEQKILKPVALFWIEKGWFNADEMGRVKELSDESTKLIFKLMELDNGLRIYKKEEDAPVEKVKEFKDALEKLNKLTEDVSIELEKYGFELTDIQKAEQYYLKKMNEIVGDANGDKDIMLFIGLLNKYENEISQLFLENNIPVKIINSFVTGFWNDESLKAVKDWSLNLIKEAKEKQGKEVKNFKRNVTVNK